MIFLFLKTKNKFVTLSNVGAEWRRSVSKCSKPWQGVLDYVPTEKMLGLRSNRRFWCFIKTLLEPIRNRELNSQIRAVVGDEICNIGTAEDIVVVPSVVEQFGPGNIGGEYKVVVLHDSACSNG